MRRSTNSKIIAAAVVGNALDWYDFIASGYLATTLAKHIFPPSSDWTPVLSTFAIFAVSFFIRPLGGLFFGCYADIAGRKAALLWSFGLMSLGTAMIALVPSYATAGWFTPITVLIARLIQGLAVGGEFATATTFLVEHADRKTRGFYGSWQIASQGAAILLVGGMVTVIGLVLSVEDFQNWGWRVPFLMGLIIGPIGIYLRFKATDTSEYARRSPPRSGESLHPLREVLSTCQPQLLTGLALVCGGTAAFYGLFIFMPSYGMRILKLEPTAAYLGPAVAGATVAIVCPFAGILSDRIGGKWVILAATTASLLTFYPSFRWLEAAPSFSRLAMVEFGFGLLVALYGGPFSSTLAELFPSSVRATGLAIVYNVSVALFGGAAPLTMAWLVAITNSRLVPAIYVTGCVFVSFVAAISLRPGKLQCRRIRR